MLETSFLGLRSVCVSVNSWRTAPGRQIPPGLANETMAQCQFKKRKGENCRANARIGKTLCVFHDPDKAGDVQRARRAGGISRNRRAVVLPPETPDFPLRNSREVSDLLGISANLVLRGQLDPRIATAVGYLTNIQLRALEQGPAQERMAKIEAALEAIEKQKKGS